MYLRDLRLVMHFRRKGAIIPSKVDVYIMHNLSVLIFLVRFVITSYTLIWYCRIEVE